MRVPPRAAVAGALAGVLAGVLLATGCAGVQDPGLQRAESSATASGTTSEVASTSSAPRSRVAPSPKASKPLAGRTIVIDPGHQLGNANFPSKINEPVPAGGFTKPCNTTGTSTNSGYPEATFVWKVSRLLAEKLRRRGATVVLTRTKNSERAWGPCVDVRGRAGNRIDADLKVSVHADGSYASGARGFHVIAPTDRRPWTHDIYRPSRRFALALRSALVEAGFRRANYIAGGDGLDFRSDLGTLNLSDIPTVMVELGNMRSRAEARVMTSAKGRNRYARALLHGIMNRLRTH